MRVNLTRALAVVIGVIFASSALAQDASLVSHRDRDSIVNERDQIVRPEPPSSYYTQSNDERFFNTADEIQTPSPVERNMGAQSSDVGGTCGTCNSCNSCNSCNGFCDNFCAACQDCPCSGLVLFSGIDSWRGIGDRATAATTPNNNNGGSSGFNYGTRLGAISDLTGIGLQCGGSYGIYDWNGRQFEPGVLTTTQSQQQVFFTLGAFKKATECCSWSFGVVHDWMVNQAWGAFAVNPTVGQWRAQISYATSACNEFGAWGTLRDRGDTNLEGLGNPISTRSINQVNAFWHHKWAFCADSWIWAGLPQQSRLDPVEGGSLGDFLVGGNVIAPLSDYLALYANMQYMHPSAAAGSIGSGEAAWNVSIGLQYYVGGTARTSTVAGNCWLPLMPVANNGSFLVDAFRAP
jgi:hypothetical protein